MVADLLTYTSCFPIVPKLACRHLGLPLTNSAKPLTLLGGLTTFGGPGNNYAMHVSDLNTTVNDLFLPLTFLQSLTAMVRELRKEKRQNGLILANGGVLTYQHALCLSTLPKRDGSVYPSQNPLPRYVTDVAVPEIATRPEGRATVEVISSLAKYETGDQYADSAPQDLQRGIRSKWFTLEGVHPGPAG